jgi:DME family drug/metabolite transporter
VLTDLAWLARPSGIAVALELGLLATAAAYLLYTRALVRLPVSRAATLSLGEPLTATLLGLIVLGERITLPQAAGAAAVAAGLVLLAARPRS